MSRWPSQAFCCSVLLGRTHKDAPRKEIEIWQQEWCVHPVSTAYTLICDDYYAVIETAKRGRDWGRDQEKSLLINGMPTEVFTEVRLSLSLSLSPSIDDNGFSVIRWRLIFYHSIYFKCLEHQELFDLSWCPRALHLFGVTPWRTTQHHFQTSRRICSWMNHNISHLYLKSPVRFVCHQPLSQDWWRCLIPRW